MFNKILLPLDIDYPKVAAAVYRNTVEIAACSNAEIKLLGVMPGFSMPIVASFISDELKKETVDRYRDSFKEFIAANCNQETPLSCSSRKPAWPIRCGCFSRVASTLSEPRLGECCFCDWGFQPLFGAPQD